MFFPPKQGAQSLLATSSPKQYLGKELGGGFADVVKFANQVEYSTHFRRDHPESPKC